MPEPPGASRSSVRAPLSKHSAPARDASRVLRARLYPHVAAELLSVPPPHSAAELSGSAEPAPEPAQTRSQCAALLVDYATDDFEAPPLVNASSSSESECELEDSPRAQKHSTRRAQAGHSWQGHSTRCPRLAACHEQALSAGARRVTAAMCRAVLTRCC